MFRLWVNRTRGGAMRTALLVQSFVLAFAVVVPILNPNEVSAGQLTSRSVSVTSSRSGQTGVSYTFNFTFPSPAIAQGIIFEFCTTPLGTCTKPTGMDVNYNTAQVRTTAGAGGQVFSQTPTFTEVVGTGAGDCAITGTNTDTKYCVSRTGGTSGTAETATAKSITIDAITNPTLAGAFLSVYPRVSIYDNASFTPGSGGFNVVHYGVTATAITQQLTTQGRVQERLEFCVAAIDDGGVTDTTLPNNCAAAPTTTTVDIGVIDSSSIVRSPVNASPTNGANDHYGIAMVNTNAAGGVTIGYYPESDTNVFGGDTDQLRSFRVASTDCSTTVTSTTDQCFVSAAAGGEVFTPGTERFGLVVPCIDNSITSGARSSTANLTINASYQSNRTPSATASTADCENDLNTRFAWNSTGSSAILASSTTVVDDEIIKLSFGATASPTTPTGLYRVTTTYIATPTF